MPTRVKICGITRPQDGLAAAAAGAHAIGLVFHPASPRYVTAAQARDIVAALPPLVSVVGLFVDAAEGVIRDLLAQVPLDLIQFHGAEPAQDCRRFGRRYLKALHVRPGADLAAAAAPYDDAAGLLLDAFVPGVPGAAGRPSTGRRCRPVCRGRCCWPVAWMPAMWRRRSAACGHGRWMSAAVWKVRPA